MGSDSQVSWTDNGSNSILASAALRPSEDETDTPFALIKLGGEAGAIVELAIREMLSEVLSEVKATRAGMSEVRDKVTSLEAREAGREREFDRRLAEFADNLRRAEETGEKRLEEFKTENGRRLERLEVENRKLQESAAKNNARWPVVAAIALAVLSLVGSIIQAAISPDPAPHPDHVSAPKP